MSTAVVPELDQELESIGTEEESTALVLQGVVALERIPAGDSAMYTRISGAGLDASANIKRLTEVFDRIIPERYAHWKRATELRAKKLAPFEEVKKKASRLVGAYEQEQERLRQEEEQRLQRKAQEDAEREQREQRELAEAEARKLSESRAIEDAIELEAAGDKAGAEAVLNHPEPVPVYVPPIYVPPVIVQKTVPKVANKSSVTTWEWRVKRSAKCRAPEPHLPTECSVCLEEVPRQYLILDTKTVGQLARALKDKFDIPGIDAYPSTGARFKG